MKKFIKENLSALILSFSLPAIIMIICYSLLDISWNGELTVLAGDSYHQYVNAHVLYRNIMHDGKGFLYTFTSGLGLNLDAFSNYYMGSFFMPLTYFFNERNMPNALYLFTILKFGFIGLSAFVSFKNMYKSLSKWLILPLAVSFSLMSFITNQSEIIMWLDVFIWIPLIMWGLHSLMDSGRKKLYFISLAILFIQNYYFGFMMAIFLVLYFFARSTINFTKEKFLKNFKDFSITSILAGMTSLISILPMYLDLKSNGETLTEISGYKTDASWYFDLFAKNFVGNYDTTKYGAIPTIYIGLFPLIFALLFFFTKSLTNKNKLAYGAVLGFITFSFYFKPLDLFWQGMHAPNMFLHRYSFIFSLLIIIMAMESLSRFNELSANSIAISASILAIGFLAVIISDHYGFETIKSVAITYAYLLVYVLIILGFKGQRISLKYTLIALSVFIISEMSVNTYYQLVGIRKDWGYSTWQHYNDVSDKLGKVSNEVKSKNFFRTDDLEPDTANDGMKFDYNAIAQFSSVRNRKSSHTMDLLGFRSDGTNLNLRYPNNTLAMDSIFGVKYNITNNTQLEKYGFQATDNTNLKKNKLAASPLIFVGGGYEDAVLDENNPISNQTNFLNRLATQQETYFEQFYKNSESIDGDLSTSGNRVTIRKKQGQVTPISFTYTLTAPAGKQSYIRIPNIYFDGDGNKDITVTVNGKATTFSPLNTGAFFNLGYYTVDTPVTMQITVVDKDNFTFDKTQLWALDIAKYEKTISKIKKTPVSTQIVKNGLEASYHSKQSGDIFITVPYDKGWTAKLDGKKVDLKEAQTGFMKLSVPSGKHKITMKFIPQGYKTGLIAFLLGIFFFLIYDKDFSKFIINSKKKIAKSN
jgi:Predicted membrane protein